MSHLTISFSESILSSSLIQASHILIDGVCLERGEFYGL